MYGFILENSKKNNDLNQDKKHQHMNRFPEKIPV